MTHQWCYKTLKERKDTTSTDLLDDDDDDDEDEDEVVPNFTCFLETCIRLFSEETRGSCDWSQMQCIVVVMLVSQHV